MTLQVWSKKLADGSTAAVAFNRGGTPVPFTFTAEMLTLSEAETAGEVRDLWQHKGMGPFGSGGYKVTVGIHDVVAIRVAAKS